MSNLADAAAGVSRDVACYYADACHRVETVIVMPLRRLAYQKNQIEYAFGHLPMRFE